MSPEKSDLLKEKYPTIFSQLNYFECGDGWFYIIDKLCSLLQNEMRNVSYGLPPEDAAELQPVAVQVKEKFGGLRFYIDGGTDTMRGMISAVESISYITCESCGNRGGKKGKAWIRTMCDGCWDQHEKRTFQSV